MKYVYRLIALAFLALAVPRALWLTLDDSRHPERWGDINHSFPLEVALLVVFAGAVVGLWWQVKRARPS